jgi:CheY-like chemotaxis protein
MLSTRLNIPLPGPAAGHANVIDINVVKSDETRSAAAGLRILLVEDDALIGMLLAELLIGMGHRICATVATEAEAIAAAARQRPQMIIIDIHLAKGNGITAIETICQARPTPHVFMTGGGQDHIPEDAAVLRKPFWEADLVRALDYAMAQFPCPAD